KADQLMRLDPDARTLTPVEWPPAFETWRARATVASVMFAGLPAPFMGDAIDARIPALVVSLPAVKRLASAHGQGMVHDADGASKIAILQLDTDRVRHDLLQALVQRHFGNADSSEYFVSVVDRDAAARVIYDSTPGVTVTAANADVTTGLFDLRLDELTRFPMAPPPPGAAAAAAEEVKDRGGINIVGRAECGGAGDGLCAGGTQGAWRVLVRGKSGSLEALVAGSRNRNLAIGLGILGLLAASLVFVIGSAQRQQRLARQQMEFVAAVSHELRTPLAVIRSAAENLADGVVADGSAVKSYGALIEAEGRRLTEMVERLMALAGITSPPAMPP